MLDARASVIVRFQNCSTQAAGSPVMLARSADATTTQSTFFVPKRSTALRALDTGPLLPKSGEFASFSAAAVMPGSLLMIPARRFRSGSSFCPSFIASPTIAGQVGMSMVAMTFCRSSGDRSRLLGDILGASLCISVSQPELNPVLGMDARLPLGVESVPPQAPVAQLDRVLPSEGRGH